MIVSWAYLYLHPGTDPVTDRTVIDRAGHRTTLVPVPDTAVAPKTAAALAEEGAQLIELCGGFGLEAAAQVRAAVPDGVPVGQMVFASDSVPSAAAFSQAASS